MKIAVGSIVGFNNGWCWVSAIRVLEIPAVGFQLVILKIVPLSRSSNFRTILLFRLSLFPCSYVCHSNAWCSIFKMLWCLVFYLFIWWTHVNIYCKKRMFVLVSEFMNLCKDFFYLTKSNATQFNFSNKEHEYKHEQIAHWIIILMNPYQYIVKDECFFWSASSWIYAKTPFIWQKVTQHNSTFQIKSMNINMSRLPIGVFTIDHQMVFAFVDIVFVMVNLIFFG
jgi:hypothetical protein